MNTPVQRSSYPITAVHPTFVADGHGRVVPWRFQKKSQKLSRTWPIWPPCTCSDAGARA
jgi:hypothetical protein